MTVSISHRFPVCLSCWFKNQTLVNEQHPSGWNALAFGKWWKYLPISIGLPDVVYQSNFRVTSPAETGNSHASLSLSLSRYYVYLYCIYMSVYLTVKRCNESLNGFLALKTNAWKPSWNLKLMISKIHTSLFLAGNPAFGFSRFHLRKKHRSISCLASWWLLITRWVNVSQS